MRRLAVLVALGLVLAVPAAAQTQQPRLAVTATSDHCAGGLPVVDYTVTNQWSTAVSAQIWWVADAWVYGVEAAHDLGPAPDSVSGSFTLPYDFYSTVTVFVTGFWADGEVSTNASWAIPVADCAAPTPPPTTLPEPTTTSPATTAPTTTIDNGNGNGNGNGQGNGNGPPTTAETG
jgi:hypothetical protein